MPAPIYVVANRGPNDFVWNGADGTWVTRTASGGLVSMLTPLAREPNVTWFCCVSEPPDARQAREGLFTTAADQTDPRLNVVPVPLPAATYHAYYGSISNEVLWMLQHHVLGRGGYEYADAARHRAWEHGYLEANRRLADTIATHAGGNPPRAVLVQDYHLYPLPALLRARFSPHASVPILHFTHIPFPEPPLLRLLPPAWRETMLRGLLAANVVGLQTARDVRAFLACCRDMLGLAARESPASVTLEDGRVVAVRAYPASVDPHEIQAALASRAVTSARQRLHELAGPDCHTIIRVDRLDPSKNQLVGFLAFRRLLEAYPDLRPRVRFLAFLVPSRTDLGVYRAYRDQVYALIQETNSRFAEACGGEPIRVFYTNDREQALAAMVDCDALLVNSLEDGMNLVVKEWALVSRRPGVAIVSETAGVAMDSEGAALLVSPLDVEGTAQAMARALQTPVSERQRQLDTLRARVLAWTAHDWLSAQLRDLGMELSAE